MNEVPAVGSDLKVLVRYVGTKEVKYDNVCHTRTIWRGEGDEQLVPIAVATQLARFPKVWEIVSKQETLGNPRFVGDSEEHGVMAIDMAGVAREPDARPGGRPILKLPKKRT